MRRRDLVHEKRMELRTLSNRELVDRICSYPFPRALNYGVEKQGEFPLEQMARNARSQNYELSKEQREIFIRNFPLLAVPDIYLPVKISPNECKNFSMEFCYKDGVNTRYETEFLLRPDSNGVMVLGRTLDGSFQELGQPDFAFMGDFLIKKDVLAPGEISDHSNGKFKNLTFHVLVDTEKLDPPEPTSEIHPTVYQTPIQLTAPVPSISNANDFLGYHKKDIEELFVRSTLSDYRYGGFRDRDISIHSFLDAVSSFSWKLHSPDSGTLSIETTRPLTGPEQSYLENFVQKEQSQGLCGFTEHMILSASDSEYPQISFDETAVSLQELPALSLTDTDLTFAEDGLAL